jgi:hypothetical protein
MNNDNACRLVTSSHSRTTRFFAGGRAAIRTWQKTCPRPDTPPPRKTRFRPLVGRYRTSFPPARFLRRVSDLLPYISSSSQALLGTMKSTEARQQIAVRCSAARDTRAEIQYPYRNFVSNGTHHKWRSSASRQPSRGSPKPAPIFSGDGGGFEIDRNLLGSHPPERVRASGQSGCVTSAHAWRLGVGAIGNVGNGRRGKGR